MTREQPETDEAHKVIEQRYELLPLLREEPWGEVWQARDRVLGADVGLKSFSKLTPRWTEAQEFYRQEARLGLMLRHPQILGVFNTGETEDLIYLVEEPFPGESLLAQLARQQRFSIHRTLHLLEQLAEALACAHGQGVVHRALNPLNILLKGEEARLANFAFPRDYENQVLYLELKAYDAPEVIHGEAPTPAANFFSLGVLGFRLVTGSLPYPLTFDEPFPYRLEGLPADLEEVPHALQNVLLRCLAEDPEERLPDAAAFLAQLAQVKEQWRSSPKRKISEWRGGKTGGAWRRGAQGAGFLGSLQAALGSGVSLARDAFAALRDRFSRDPRGFLRLAGLAAVIVILLYAGVKIFSRPRPAIPPLPAGSTAPSAKVPTVKTPATPTPAPPAETPQAAPGREAPPAAGPAPARPPAEAQPPAKEGRYLVIAGSFSKAEEAKALSQRLRAHKFHATVVKKTKKGKPATYVVQLGPFAGAKEAQEVARRLKTQEKITPRLQKLAAGPTTSKPSRRAAR